jgi:hypothetical protein
MSRRRWIRDHALGLLFASLFLLTWAGQAVVQWFEYADDQHTHHAAATLGGFLLVFGRATLENWQSEFLQLASFVIFSAYLIYRGSPESRDGQDRLEAKVDQLLHEHNIDPAYFDRAR